MTAPRFRAYLALSIDGYIADAEGRVKWLERFHHPSIDFESFNRSVDTIVVGRKTFDQAKDMGGWPDTGKPTIVLTRRPLKKAPTGVRAFKGDVRALADELVEQGSREVWLMGGGRSLMPFHEAGLISRWELFVMPVLLGTGVPLFPERQSALDSFRLAKCRSYGNGVIEVHCEPALDT